MFPICQMGGKIMVKTLKWAAIIVALAICADILVTFIYPDVSILKKYNPKTTAFMEYRKEQWAEKGIRRTINHRWVKMKKVSPYLVKAVIIAEDDKFWKHDGFDFDAMKKALEKDIAHGKLKAGGSSISQQLAKNLYLSPSKNPIRKIKEAILTWRIEKALSKKRIMEIYLNVAEWGDGVFGIDAAARHHYGKKAYSLSAQEAVRLACVLPNPIIFNPLSDSPYVKKRSRAIYRVMIRRGIVIPDYEEVMSAPEEKTEEMPVDIMNMGVDEETTTETTDSFETTNNPEPGDNSPADNTINGANPEQGNGPSVESGDTASPVEETAPAEDNSNSSENKDNE